MSKRRLVVVSDADYDHQSRCGRYLLLCCFLKHINVRLAARGQHTHQNSHCAALEENRSCSETKGCSPENDHAILLQDVQSIEMAARITNG